MEGFEGVRCEVNIDDCKDHTCQNGATCIDEIQSYSCQCPFGFAGKLCRCTKHTKQHMRSWYVSFIDK